MRRNVCAGSRTGAEASELSERYEYTAEGLLKSAISRSGTGDITRGMRYSYAYDSMGRLERKSASGRTLLSLAYDMNGNLTRQMDVTGKVTEYRHDGNGRRVEKRQIQGLTTYAYDSMNRLSAAEYPGGKEELFYDRAGNRIRRVWGGEEELYQYDSRNRLTEYTRGGVSREYQYDNAGNLLEDGRAGYEYDAFNRCTKVETPDGNIQVNRYDAEGLRHEMEENGELVSFSFRDREVVAEEGQAGRIRYIRTGELLASDAEYARTYYHYASDEMGSITHVVAGWGSPEPLRI